MLLFSNCFLLIFLTYYKNIDKIINHKKTTTSTLNTLKEAITPKSLKNFIPYSLFYSASPIISINLANGSLIYFS